MKSFQVVLAALVTVAAAIPTIPKDAMDPMKQSQRIDMENHHNDMQNHHHGIDIERQRRGIHIENQRRGIDMEEQHRGIGMENQHRGIEKRQGISIGLGSGSGITIPPVSIPTISIGLTKGQRDELDPIESEILGDTAPTPTTPAGGIIPGGTAPAGSSPDGELGMPKMYAKIHN